MAGDWKPISSPGRRGSAPREGGTTAVAVADGRSQYAECLRQVERLLWETAERLDELAEQDQWPPPRERLCEMAAVLVRLGVTIDDLGHATGSNNGDQPQSS